MVTIDKLHVPTTFKDKMKVNQLVDLLNSDIEDDFSYKVIARRLNCVVTYKITVADSEGFFLGYL